jgi:sugar (pentulose or hexulose) kinase
MPDAALVIGVDIGTQSTKALRTDATGRILAQASESYQPDTPRPLWAEQWPQVWLDAVVASIRRCVTPETAADVRAVCISGLYGGSGIPVDAALEPLHPCLIWLDRRAEAQARSVRANIDVALLQATTGNGIDSYYGFTKMLWLRDERPDVWSRTRTLVPPNAWVIAKLSGELAVDHSSAGNIGGVYDINARGWSASMLDALDIPATMMPQRLVGSSDVVGHLQPAWAEATGLLAGTPIIAGGVDAAVATFAAGATRAGQHVAMIGTSMCWGTITRSVDARHGLVSMPNVFRGATDTYTFGGAATAGGAEAWFRTQFCGPELAQESTGQGSAVDLLNRAAAKIPPGADGLVFLPYLAGERSPIWDGLASGSFVGLSLYHTRAHLYRAVLEGVAYALRHNIDAARAAMPDLDDRLVVVGGASKSDLWMQIIADVTGYQVQTIQQDVECAMGSALLAALGVGLVSPEQAQAGWVTLLPRAIPDTVARGVYDRRYTIFTGLYPALRESMHQLRNMPELPV